MEILAERFINVNKDTFRDKLSDIICAFIHDVHFEAG